MNAHIMLAYRKLRIQLVTDLPRAYPYGASLFSSVPTGSWLPVEITVSHDSPRDRAYVCTMTVSCDEMYSCARRTRRAQRESAAVGCKTRTWIALSDCESNARPKVIKTTVRIWFSCAGAKSPSPERREVA